MHRLVRVARRALLAQAAVIGSVACSCSSARLPDDAIGVADAGAQEGIVDRTTTEAVTAREAGAIVGARVRRMTNAEYDATVRALLATEQTPSSLLPPDARLHPRSRFERNGAQVVDPMMARQLQVAAEALAQEYVTTRLAEDAPCTGNAVCARLFFLDFLPKAYRRAVADDELDEFMSLLVTPALDRDGFEGAVRLGIEAVLQSASLLYHTELGDGDATPGSVVTLTHSEIAQSMAYLLTGGPADAQLLDSGDLTDAATRRDEALRLLQSPGARRQVHRLVEQWLGIDSAGGLVKDADKFPEFKPNLFARESEAFVDEVVFERGGGFALLIGADFTVGGAELAATYDAPGPEVEPGIIDLSSVPRRGLLNRGAYLATNAGPTHPSPVKRGVRFLTQVLCIEPGNPAELMLQVTLPVVRPAETRRQRFEQHDQAPCVGCHGTIDPIGFSFEHFDASGTWEASEDGDPSLPIDSAVRLRLPPDVSFATAQVADSSELALLASESEVGRRCFARNAARFTMAAYGEGVEESLLAEWNRANEEGRDGVQDLLVAYIASAPFVQRRGEATEGDR